MGRPNHLAEPNRILLIPQCITCGEVITWIPTLKCWDHAVISAFPVSTAEITMSVKVAQAGNHGQIFWVISSLMTFPSGYLANHDLSRNYYPMKGNNPGESPDGYTMAEAMAMHSARMAEVIENGQRYDPN